MSFEVLWLLVDWYIILRGILFKEKASKYNLILIKQSFKYLRHDE